MKRLLIPVGLSLAVSLTGCGGADVPEVGDVSGTVTIDGKPVQGVRVNFMPAESGRPSSGVTDENGYYELAYSANSMGALLGSHTVSITPPEPSVDAADVGGSAPLVDQSIPREYLAIKKQVEVEAGDNTIDLTYP